MARRGHLITTSIKQALGELKVHKLRTFLSLLGITIGIFCIIAVLTVVDSMENNIQKEMATLGSDVLYVTKQPWIPEETEYKWWDYIRRKPMTVRELDVINKNVHGVKYAALCYADGIKIKHGNEEAEGVISYAVTDNFDKLQNFEIEEGRYLSASELGAGAYVCVIGDEVKQNLFIGQTNPIGKTVSFEGRKFTVVGTMKRSGKNMAGFNFDNAVIYSYATARSLNNLTAVNWGVDPLIMVKARDRVPLEELKLEIEGALRSVRKIKPGEKKDFAINQLSTIAAMVGSIFATIGLVGFVIAAFSLIVGGFGIANIMFVTVKERTKIIGLKKAIGARPKSILMEFLVEAITLCITGGFIGILVVFLLSLLMTYGFDFPVTLSFKNFFIGVGISGSVGVIAGYIPARSASRLDPVVAIRSN